LNADQNVALPITGLAPGSTIYYQAVAVNSLGSSTGSVQTLSVSAQPPAPTTLAASGITATNATLNASVNPEGAPTSVYFQWGPTTGYGHFTATNTLSANLNSDQAVAIGTGAFPFGATNHFRAVAINASGVVWGADETVTPNPRMSAVFAGQKLLVAWPTNYAAFTLHFTTNLNGPIIWSPVPNPAGVQGGSYIVTNQVLTGDRFYRLRE
jgi:hypothetical protein